MQMGWKEYDFTNLTAKVWANLDIPIKRYDFSKCWLISCMPSSQVALCYNLWCHNYMYMNGPVHKFHKIVLFHENTSSLYIEKTVVNTVAAPPPPPLWFSIYIFFLLVSSAISHGHDDTIPLPHYENWKKNEVGKKKYVGLLSNAINT